MNQLMHNFTVITKKKKAKQIGSLYTSIVLGIVIGIGFGVLNILLLGHQRYGDLKFL